MKMVVLGFALFLTSSAFSSQDTARFFIPSDAVRAPSSHKYSEDIQHPDFLKWARQKQHEIKDIIYDERLPDEIRYTTPAPIQIPNKLVRPRTQREELQARETTSLYFRLIGRNNVNSLLWSGIESGNPLTRHMDYRWDSLMEQGIYEPYKDRDEEIKAGKGRNQDPYAWIHAEAAKRRKTHQNRLKVIAQLKKQGIRNMRIGLSNHDIDLEDERSWKETSNMIRDFASGGINLSLDLHHFGIEDRFLVKDEKGQIKHEESFYLHKDWPDYFAAFALKAIQKYGTQIKAITIMNEPETVVGFNGEMWHGGFPGWAHKDNNMIYIRRSMQIAMASVKARLAIENYRASLPAEKRPEFLYVHTEASVHKKYWEDFNLYRRFIISDMILGHEGILNGDLSEVAAPVPVENLVGRWHRTRPDRRTNFDWIVENYIVYNQQGARREELRNDFVTRFKKMKGLHQELATRFRKTMRTDTVFAVDYYAHNEDRDQNMDRLDPEPQNYPDQLSKGRRAGLYHVLVDYYNHFKMPLMIGESGTPYFHYGAMWNQQMLLECAKAAEAGIPFLGYTIYPAIDTWGWESALSVPRDKAIYNPSGLMNLKYEPQISNFMVPLRKSLEKHIPAQ